MIQVPVNRENHEISINYVMTCEKWNRDKIIVDDTFACCYIALKVLNDNEYHEARSVEECKRQNEKKQLMQN